MRLLLTNDDGVTAPGLAALIQVAKRLGECTVVAPLNPHSYQGHRITAERSLSVSRETDSVFAVNGTPVDCVRLGLQVIAPRVDWVVAGINAGSSLGADIFTSSTVAAAWEAALLGYRAVAVSHFLARGHDIEWELAAERLFRVLRTLLSSPLEPHSFWNINLPHVPPNRPVTVAFCPLDPSPLDIQYVRHGSTFSFVGQFHPRPLRRGFDVASCTGGDITITKIPAFPSRGVPGRDYAHSGDGGGSSTPGGGYGSGR